MCALVTGVQTCALPIWPTHTRRSETSQALQQFSTPAGLGVVAAIAAAIRPGDVVLEPSAGTGLLAVHAKNQGARLLLNELAEIRAEVGSEERSVGKEWVRRVRCWGWPSH